jgi:hypothetical protein
MTVMKPPWTFALEDTPLFCVIACMLALVACASPSKHHDHNYPGPPPPMSPFPGEQTLTCTNTVPVCTTSGKISRCWCGDVLITEAR